jgi:hypothetical protein
MLAPVTRHTISRMHRTQKRRPRCNARANHQDLSLFSDRAATSRRRGWCGPLLHLPLLPRVLRCRSIWMRTAQHSTDTGCSQRGRPHDSSSTIPSHSAAKFLITSLNRILGLRCKCSNSRLEGYVCPTPSTHASTYIQMRARTHTHTNTNTHTALYRQPGS